MKIIRMLAALVAALLIGLLSSPGFSQSGSVIVLPGGCGTGSAVNGLSYLTVDSTFKLCVNATVNASVTGFRPTAYGTPISVVSTAGGTSGTLPSGSEVVATNVGTTNGAYCALGATATTSDQYIAPNGGWFAFAISGDTQLTCITATGTTTVNTAGGTGLPTGTGGGGGSGGGGGGAITAASGSYAAGAFSAGAAVAGSWLDGWDQTQGAKADAACGTATGTCSSIALLKFLNSQVTAPPPLNLNGTNTAWTGLTPGVAQTGTIVAANTDLTSVKGTAISTGTGAQGTGTPRVTVATDQATNAGAALVKGGVGVVNGGNFYQAVAASQTATVLQSSTGAAGDYLSHCVIYPTSTSPGVVTVFDNTNTAATSAILFAGGATSTSNLTPISVPVGAVSTAGAWKVTTGAAVSVVCYGKFS